MVERTVNLTELATVLRVSEETMRKVLRKREDAPVLSRGSNGVAYEFDLDEFTAWWRKNKAVEAEAQGERAEQLRIWSSDLYGEEPEEAQGLSVADRRALADAIRAEDYNRRQRGELVERRALEATLAAVVTRLRGGLLRLPTDMVKRHGMPAELRREMEQAIEHHLNSLAEDLGSEDSYAGSELEHAA